MTPKRGGLASNPAFNSNVFQFGQHLGSQPNAGGLDLAGILNDNIWGQSFQDPYQAGPNTPPGMIAPPPGAQMGGGMFPGTPSQNPNMSMQQPDMGMPQQQDGSFWENAGQFLTSDVFKDSLMSGVIAGQMASDPQGALRLAIQWREYRDQRKFRAEQNQLNREAQQENTKARAEAAKAHKEQATYEKRIGKIQAGLQAGNVPPEVVQAWMAENGPPSPENIDKAEADFAIMQSQVKAQAQQEKEQKTRVDLLGRVAKGTLPASAVKNFYKGNAEVAETADHLEKQFKDMYNLNLKVKQERAEQLKQAGRLAARLGPEAKEALSIFTEDAKLIYAEIADLIDIADDPERKMKYAVAHSLGTDDPIDLEKTHQEILAKIDGLRARASDLRNQRFKTAGGKGLLPKTEPVIKPNAKIGDPGSDDESTYQELKAIYSSDAADAWWLARFDTPRDISSPTTSTKKTDSVKPGLTVADIERLKAKRAAAMGGINAAPPQ